MKILISHLGSNVRKKVNQYDEDDLTPLHYAARYNHLSVVKILVEAGAGMWTYNTHKSTYLVNVLLFFCFVFLDISFIDFG